MAAWHRDTEGKFTRTSALRIRPIMFSQWVRSYRAPLDRLTKPHTSGASFRPNSEMPQRSNTHTAAAASRIRPAHSTVGSALVKFEKNAAIKTSHTYGMLL